MPYEKIYCPKCKTHLLVYLGDWEDDTSPTVEGVTCPKCDENFLMGDEFAKREMLNEIIWTHYDLDDHGIKYEDFRDHANKDMLDVLLAGGEWRGQNLSQFLKEQAFLQRGEVLPS